MGPNLFGMAQLPFPLLIEGLTGPIVQTLLFIICFVFVMSCCLFICYRETVHLVVFMHALTTTRGTIARTNAHRAVSIGVKAVAM